MKKFLLSLAVLFAAGAVAQKQYKTVEMLTDIPADETFLLAGDPDAAQFLTTDGQKNLTTAADDNALIIFEAVDEQTESGFDLYAIKFVATGEYIEDQVITDGMDSSDILNDKLPYFTTTSDLGSAAKWTILPAETRYKVTKGEEGWEETWRTYTGQGTGTDTEESTGNKFPYDGAFVIMRDNLTEGGADAVYLEVMSDYTLFAPWGNNDWYLFSYEEKTVDDVLQEWWDTNYPEGPEALESAVGNRIGQYDEASVAGLLEAYEAYTAWLIDGEGDAEEILAMSKAAQEALKINEMKEGYYYVVSKRQLWAAYDDNGVMRGNKGFEVPVDEETGETTVTFETSKYIWYFTPVEEKENTYIVKNYFTSRYVTTSAHNDNTGIKTGDFEKAVDYTVAYHPNYPGTVMLYNLDANGSMTCAWNIFSGNGGVIGNWKNGGYPENDEGNFFYLYNVADELVEAIADEVKQYQRNERLLQLYESARFDYQKGWGYVPDSECTLDDDFTNHGYLWYEEETVREPGLDEYSIINSNLTIVDSNGNPAIHPSDGSGSVVGLLDNQMSTITHTYWSHTTHPHFFEIDLGEGNALDAIAIKMLRRTQTSEHNANFGFGEVKVFGRNSEEDEWTYVSNLKMTYDINLYAREEDGSISVDEDGNPVLASWSADNGEGYVGLGTCNLGDSYRYLRIQHWKTLNDDNYKYLQENTYFSASEMALFGATLSEEKSLNTAVPANVLAAFETEMAKAKAELNVGKATEEQIIALQIAYEAYLEKFPHPELLKDALATAKQIANNLPIDDEAVGYYPQSALNAYNAAIAAVEATVADVMTVEVIDSGIAKLDAAKAELLKSLNMFTSGFYQIKIGGGDYEEALMHSSCVAADTKEVKGLRVDFAKPVYDEDYGYVEDENYASSVSSIWYLEVAENNKVAIRSLGNGLYLQPCLEKSNHQTGTPYVQLTTTKTYFEVQADGLFNGGLYNIILGADTTTVKGAPLYANIHSASSNQSGHLVAWDSANGDDNSTFKLEVIDLADFGYGANTFVLGNNKTQFFTLPYDAVMYGQSAKVCEVVGYYEDPETNEKAVYFKNIQEDGAVIEGGKAYLVQTDAETDFLQVSFEDEVAGFESFNYTYTAKEANGLQATIFSEKVGPNFGVLNLAYRIIATENTKETDGSETLTTIAPMSGYIIPSKVPHLDFAPEGEEYVKLVSLIRFEPEPEPEPNYTCTLKDGIVYSNRFNKECTEITYTRTLPNLYWNALYIPFEVPYATIADKYNVAYINAIRSYDHDEDGTIDDLEMEVVKIKAGTLKANYPYLIQAKTEAAKEVAISVSNATLYAAQENSIDCSTVYQKYQVTGTYNIKSATELKGKLAISINGAWQPLATGSQLNPYRLYMSITNRNDSPVKVNLQALSKVRIIEKGQFTGIDEVDTSTSVKAIYDLSGRKVKQPVKGGVYIQDGQKIIF